MNRGIEYFDIRLAGKRGTTVCGSQTVLCHLLPSIVVQFVVSVVVISTHTAGVDPIALVLSFPLGILLALVRNPQLFVDATEK